MAFATSSPSVLLSSSAAFFGANADKRRSGPAAVKLPRRASTVAAAAAAYVSERVHVASRQPSMYDVLGLQPGATCQEIKTAYRRLARVVHPDVAAGNGTNGQSSSYEFMKVHEAYATLSDPEKRADYDQVLLMHRLNSSLARSTASRYGGYTATKNWETDQCW